MKVKFGLRLKFTLIFAALMLMVSLVLFYCLYANYKKIFQNQLLIYAESIAELVRGMTSEEKLREYAVTQKTDQEYDKLIEEMKVLQAQAKFYYLYLVVVEQRGAGIYICDLKLVNEEYDHEGDAEPEIVFNHKLGETNVLENKFTGLIDVLETGESSKKFNRIDYHGVRLDSVYVPIVNELGEVSAFVGVDFKHQNLVDDIREEMSKFIPPLCMVMAPSCLILIGLLQLTVLRPVYQLKEHARQVSAGNYNYEMKIRGNDEVSEILKVYSGLSAEIAENITAMQQLSEAYYRYVPSKILSLLGQETIEDIGLGDEVSAMLTVVSFQLADFDRIIKKMSTREMVNAINQVLRVSVSVMSEQEGMIEGFQNAGFTALFEGNVENALLGAVQICQDLNRRQTTAGLGAETGKTGQVQKEQVNHHWGAIGIAYGQVTLGIVGHERRLAAITVSPYRDMACYLQSIARAYHAHILVTQETAQKIPHFFETYHTRNMGFLYNTFTGYWGKIYDVYDGDSREIFRRKNATKELFEQGVEYYCLRKFKEARQKFIAVLKEYRQDNAAKEYIYLCDKYVSVKDKEAIEICFLKME